MNILALDTAGKTAAVAVLRDETLLYESFCNIGLTHSETVLPLVDAALRICGLTPAQIELYGVTAGPGSFTGLRIGLSLIKGMALPHGTPCAGVSTLEAFARGCVGQGTVVPALDARRGQVYWAAFDLGSHARLTPDAAEPLAALENLLKSCAKPVFFVGDGAALCYNRYKDLPGVLPCPPALRGGRGAGVGLAALELYRAGGAVPAAALLPDYHRLSQAERERAAREAAEKEPSA